ncbi:transposase, partial [Paracoccus binzhouensis]|uniref:transposase n=1 Tax=Paracoccus binzhouensis TaxID=2796149 RepID=UPI002FCE5FB5
MVTGRHEQSDAPACKTGNGSAYNEVLKRRGLLTIRFDPAMTWKATPTGRRGRQQTCSDTAIRTCLRMKVLFGMARRQATGFVESLLQLVIFWLWNQCVWSLALLWQKFVEYFSPLPTAVGTVGRRLTEL